MLCISDIQHFSVGDGDGIRTTVFFKGCNLRCPWCHNPENLQFAPVTLFYKNLNKTEVKGKQVSSEEILPELLEDKDFYDESGGGVTLSGGEVMLQAEGAAELAKQLLDSGVLVLIDTAGCVPYSAFEKLNPVVQGYLFDFKTADPEKYKQIGGNLQLVTENIQKLLKEDVKLYIRIPLIPGFNTDTKSLLDICKHLTSIGIQTVDLLPFHRLGSGKYEALGLDYPYAHISPLSQTELNNISQFFAENGIAEKRG